MIGLDIKRHQTSALLSLFNFNKGADVNILNPTSQSGPLHGLGNSSSHINTNASLNALLSASEFSSEWKVLIYDRRGRDIISPLFNVNILRKRGVTIYFLIDDNREEIPDVPALYFVEPNEKNVNKIIEDCSRKLYNGYYVNFISRCDRPLLEHFAKGVVNSGGTKSVQSVYDLYLNYITLEKYLYTLNFPKSYLGYNSPSLNEEGILAYVEKVTHGIFSVLATFSVIPVIRCRKGGVSEQIARRLRSLLAEHISLSSFESSLFNSASMSSIGGNMNTFQRPLLLLVDREEDLVTPLRHTGSYQALMSDVLSLNMNRVTIRSRKEDNNGNSKGMGRNSRGNMKVYDVDADEDQFFSKYANTLFPEAIEGNSTELQEVCRREDEIKQNTVSSAVEGLSGTGGSSTGDSGKNLLSAVDSLPILLAKKKVLETHTNILEAIMEEIKARDIPLFHEIEDTILSNSSLYNSSSSTKNADLEKVKGLLRDGNKGSLLDKTRLLATFILSCNIANSEITEIEEGLRNMYTAALTQNQSTDTNENTEAFVPEHLRVSEAEINTCLRCINLLRKQLALQQHGGGFMATQGSAGENEKGYSSILSKAQSKATAFAKSFLSKKAGCYITQQLDICMKEQNSANTQSTAPSSSGSIGSTGDGGSQGPYSNSGMTGLADEGSNSTTDLLYLDPKTREGVNIRTKAICQDAMVFVVGGGCYSEYHEVMEWGKIKVQQQQHLENTSGALGFRSVLYGCTEMLNSEELIDQMAEISRLSSV